MEKLLEVRDFRMHFISRTEQVAAVDGVSFDVYEGETFGLVGESGSGKSQTCRAILRLIKPPGKVLGGQVLYRGRDILGMSKREIRAIRGKEIAIVFQEPMTALNPVLKIKVQIYEALLKSNLTRNGKIGRTVELLRLVGIPGPEQRKEDYTHQFSGGMRQRAMIAAALAAGPKLLLADEPTTALDVTIQDQVLSLMNELKEKLGMSMILVTHDLGVIAQMCDRVAVMYAGHIVEMADTVTLFSKPRNPYTYALMGSLPERSKLGQRLEPISGSPPDLTNLPGGCPFWPRCSLAKDICREELPEMTEIGPGHTSRCHCHDRTTGFRGLIGEVNANA